MMPSSTTSDQPQRGSDRKIAVGAAVLIALVFLGLMLSPRGHPQPAVLLSTTGLAGQLSPGQHVAGATSIELIPGCFAKVLPGAQLTLDVLDRRTAEPPVFEGAITLTGAALLDRKSTRLNSSHRL